MQRSTFRLLVLPLALAAPLLAPGCGDDGAGSCPAGVAVGELVISEIQVDPEGADDEGVEWFELYNASDRSIKLTGLGLEYSKVDGSEAKGHRISEGPLEIGPGEYRTFGRIADDLKPAYIDYGFGADLQMGNSEGKLRVVCGSTVVDETNYEDIVEGQTHSLDGKVGPPDAEINDDPARWCAAADAEAYIPEEFGTPGAANGECPLPMPAGCGQCYEGEQLRDAIAPRPGQLVINEFMPNASSAAESVGEWFELYVADGPVDLNCLQFGGNTTKFATDVEDAETVNAPECLTVEAGTHLIFGDKEKWPEADYEIGFTLVDSVTTSNPDPGIYVAYEGAILDEIHYTKATDGVAWSLDPDFADPADNDDPAAFCLAVDPFIAGELGTPGAENPQCPESCPTDSCIEGDACRAIRFLTAGDALITEVFPDPGAMSPDGEWFEFIVGADADLNGLVVGKTLGTTSIITDATCVPVSAGDTILVAATADESMNGGITPDLVHDKLSLTNSGSSLMIGTIASDGTPAVLDEVFWTTTHDARSHQLAAELVPAAPFDPTVNDAPEAWCDANVMFGVGDFGTPDADNTSCEGPPPGDPMCLDGDTPRPIVFAKPGDLLITEIHADPKSLLEQNPASGEPQGEWFEIWAAAAVDLNGLELGSPALKYTIPSGETEPCVSVGKGSLAVLARRGAPTDPPTLPADPLDNGGLPTIVAAYDGLSLSNSGGTVSIGVAGVEIDSVTFGKPAPGKAQQLGANAGCLLADPPLDPACNDGAMMWCAATEVYGLGDFGSPAADNGLCIAAPAQGECFDTDLQMNRPIVAPVPGDLIITEFLANPSGTETDKEWVEVYVKNAVDLNDLKILGAGAPMQADVDAALPSCKSNTCVPLAADSYILLAKKLDTNINGGLPPVDCLLVPSLSNSNDGIAVAHGSDLLHGVSWTKTQAEDKTGMLDPASKDPMHINADAAPWCVAAGTGTPKQENPSCP